MEPELESEKLKNLLSQIRLIIEQGERLAKLQGENFNIFSILSMESAENKTHSAFLSELLNPRGTHGMGVAFLRTFVSMLQLSTPIRKQLNDFTCEGASVTTEYHTGAVDLESSTGGRIDLYIKDSNGLSIIIENKIFAGDQPKQIERYCNFNPQNNTVFYLTLNGTEPDKTSRGNLVAGEDFYLLSYRNHIIDWLTECQRISTDQPILRETIKQYIILLKKLTNQLTINAMKEDVSNIILRNLKESKYIFDNYQATVAAVRNAFRNAVCEEIRLLEPDCRYYLGGDISGGNAHIIIDTDTNDVKIIVESFSGQSWFSNDGLCVGLFVRQNRVSKERFDHIKTIFDKKNLQHEGWWFGRKKLGGAGELILSDLEVVSALVDGQYRQVKAKLVAAQIMDFKKEHAELLDTLE